MRAILAALFLACMAQAHAGVPVCLFPMMGQSNMVGAGNSAQSPHHLSGTLQFYGGALTPADDPIGSGTGSLGPAFANAFWQATGVITILVPAAVNATSQTKIMSDYFGHPAGLHWDEGGTLLPAAIVATRSALQAASSPALNYNPRVCGVLWAQGEDEGFGVNQGVIDVGQYDNAFAGMITRFRIEFPGAPFFIIRLGTPNGSQAIYEPGFAQIRGAQESRARNDSRTIIASRLASSFDPAFGMAPGAVGELHIGQPGLNMIGAEAGANVVASGLWKN